MSKECNCLLNVTEFGANDINFDEVNIVSTFNNWTMLLDGYTVETSGIWRPVFWYDQPYTEDESWYPLSDSDQTILDPGDNRCSDSATPYGLGINRFFRIYPKPPLNVISSKYWYISNNVQIDIDWVINFEKCVNYDKVILFWYRYYDINRSGDQRLIPGVDIFISDGDYAVIDGEPRLSDNLINIGNQLEKQLIEAGVSNPKEKAYILASGPQIDGISEILTNPDPDGFKYNRDIYGQMLDTVNWLYNFYTNRAEPSQSLLKAMSNKLYMDIGKYNFISTKVMLAKKLIQKYGTCMYIPELTPITFTSKFISETGPNVKISFDDLILMTKNKNLSCGYDFSCRVGDLKFIAYSSTEIATPTAYNEDDEEYVYGEPHNINYFKLNDLTIGYNFSNKNSGIFNPGIHSVSFHGLGGIDIDIADSHYHIEDISASINSVKGSQTKGLSRLQKNRLENDSFSYTANFINPNQGFDGPYFIQDYTDIPNESLHTIENTPSNIEFYIYPKSNSMIKMQGKVKTSYLRSESKKLCDSFGRNKECECYSIFDTVPNTGNPYTIKEINNDKGILYTPGISSWNVPTSYYYGELSVDEVNNVGIFPPGHPSPGTLLPRLHKPIPKLGNSCSYTYTGSTSTSFTIPFPYPCKIKVRYSGSDIKVAMSWNGKASVTDEFTSVENILCLEKNLDKPENVNISIENRFESQYELTIEAEEYAYPEELINTAREYTGVKGFFHPNFGWTFNRNFYNKTAVLQDHKIVKLKPPSRRQIGGYSLLMRYIKEPQEDECGGGHTCNRAIFDVYLNNVYIGQGNFNNGGGASDPVPNDVGGSRAANFGFPSNLTFIDGSKIELNIKCALSACHGGVVQAEVLSPNGQVVWKKCVGVNETTLIDIPGVPDNPYMYNSHAMYNREYIDGYNYMIRVDSETSKEVIENSPILAVQNSNGCYFIANRFDLFPYTQEDSRVLQQVPFEYINIDYKYGYAYKNFGYTIEPPTPGLRNRLRIVGTDSLDLNRIISYFDDTGLISGKNLTVPQTITIFNPFTTNIIYNLQITSVFVKDGSCFLLVDDTENLADIYYSPLRTGFISRTKPSFLIYRNNITVGDDINVGKWGMNTYGEGVSNQLYNSNKEEFEEKNISAYNNASLRYGATANTAISWGCPFSMSPNYRDTYTIPFFPVSRVFDEFKDPNNPIAGRKIATFGTENTYQYNNGIYEGNHVVSSGAINDTYHNLYVGAYQGNYKLSLTFNKKDDALAKTKFRIYLYEGNKLHTADHTDIDDNKIEIKFLKETLLPIYGTISLVENVDYCHNSVSNFSVLQFANYKLSIDDPPEELLKNRVSYYPHGSSTKPLSASPITIFDTGIPIPYTDTIYETLLINSGYFKTEQSKGYNYLDMHLFYNKQLTDNAMFYNLLGSSGYIYFEDFLEPRSETFINTMEVPYDENKYWINFRKNQKWDLLTSNNILLEKNKMYKTLKKLSYTCDSDAAICSKQYKNDLCKKEVTYDISQEDLISLLGLSEEESQFLDIKVVSFPSYCNTINNCCSDIEDETDRQACLDDQDKEIEKCLDEFAEPIEVRCDIICPESESITGEIKKTIEYFVYYLRNDAEPNLMERDYLTFKLFSRRANIQLPCTNQIFDSVGSSFLINRQCDVTDQKCGYIIDQLTENQDGGFISARQLDFPVDQSTETSVVYKSPQSVIIDNELRYRNSIPQGRTLSGDLVKEYDTNAELEYSIKYEFQIASGGKCIVYADKKLFDISIDEQLFSFKITKRQGRWVIESNRFQDIALSTNRYKSTEYYLDKHFYTAIPKVEESDVENCRFENNNFYWNTYLLEDVSCDKASEYLPESAHIVSCNEELISGPFPLVKTCGDIEYCSNSKIKADPGAYEHEFHCNAWETLVQIEGDENDYFNNYRCKGKRYYVSYWAEDPCDDSDTDYCDYTAFSDCSYYETPITLRGLLKDDSQILKDQAFNECLNGRSPNYKVSLKYKQIQLAAKSEDQYIDAYEGTYGGDRYIEGVNSRRQYDCVTSKIWEDYHSCMQTCYDRLNKCDPFVNGDGCYKAYSSCACSCASKRNNAADAAFTSYMGQMKSICLATCNYADVMIGGIWTPYVWNAVGYGYTDLNGGCDQDPCGGYSYTNLWHEPNDCYGVGCDGGYNPCWGAEKRSKISWTESPSSCKKDYDGYTYLDVQQKCRDRTTLTDTIASTSTVLSREIEHELENEYYIPTVEDISAQTDVLRVYHKKLNIRYTMDTDPTPNLECDPPCSDSEECCEGVCVEQNCCENEAGQFNYTMTIFVYKNYITASFNSGPFTTSNQEVCLNRQNTKLFKCPKISIKLYDNDLYINSRSLDSKVSECYSGVIP